MSRIQHFSIVRKLIDMEGEPRMTPADAFRIAAETGARVVYYPESNKTAVRAGALSRWGVFVQSIADIERHQKKACALIWAEMMPLDAVQYEVDPRVYSSAVAEITGIESDYFAAASFARVQDIYDFVIAICPGIEKFDQIHAILAKIGHPAAKLVAGILADYGIGE